METGNGFDMEQYIRKRMMEISQLEDRASYKEIVGNLLLELLNGAAAVPGDTDVKPLLHQIHMN